MDATKHVYYFGGQKADGNREMKMLLGGKGGKPCGDGEQSASRCRPASRSRTAVCANYQKTQTIPEDVAVQVPRERCGRGEGDGHEVR